jgi:hypothetical protein
MSPWQELADLTRSRIIAATAGMIEAGEVTLTFQALCAPSPPFHKCAWFVILGDDAGEMLELLPERVILDPGAPLGLAWRGDAPGKGAAHVLVTSPLPMAEIVAFARNEGWRAEEVESGLFEIVKVWVQGAFLVEFISQEKVARYTDTFGREGMAALDGKLRTLEQDLARKLGSMMPPEKLSKILGSSP